MLNDIWNDGTLPFDSVHFISFSKTGPVFARQSAYEDEVLDDGSPGAPPWSYGRLQLYPAII